MSFAEAMWPPGEGGKSRVLETVDMMTSEPVLGATSVTACGQTRLARDPKHHLYAHQDDECLLDARSGHSEPRSRKVHPLLIGHLRHPLRERLGDILRRLALLARARLGL